MILRNTNNLIVENPNAQRSLWALVLILGVCALAWNLYRDMQLTWAQPETLRTSPSSTANSTALQITPLLNAHLFGEISQTKNASPAKPTNTPETRLRLTLRGVFAHSNHDQSRALIAEQGQSAKYYRLGDSLSGGATLDAVASSYVTLNRNGTLETLSFKTSKKNASDSVARQDNAAAPPKAAVQPSQRAAMVSQKSTRTIKERLQSLREARDL